MCGSQRTEASEYTFLAFPSHSVITGVSAPARVLGKHAANKSDAEQAIVADFSYFTPFSGFQEPCRRRI